jgi:hypothetical protein
MRGAAAAFAIVVAVVLMHAAGGGRDPSQTPPLSTSCDGSAYRQFDFWVGDWDAVEAGEVTPRARVRVTRILDGCAIREEYQDGSGLIGESLSTYDRSRQVWHQSWVTNRGQLLLLDGEFRGGAIVLTGSDPAAGAAALVRGTWTATRDGVREVGVMSPDGGKTWRPWFDLSFRRHQS